MRESVAIDAVIDETIRRPITVEPLSDDELRGIPLFESVNLATVRPLLRTCPVKLLHKDEVLISARRTNRHLYVVLSGCLSVRLASCEAAPITELGVGETVGELSVIDNQPTSAFVVAQKPTRVLEIDEDLIWMLVNTSHSVSTNLLYTLVKRLRYDNVLMFENHERIEQYRFHATVDALTGLFNRHWLNNMLPRQVHRSRICGEPLSLMMLDIDHFKKFNDCHGHVAGDRAIGTTAKSLLDTLRPTDMAMRYGGEEFLVILPNCMLEPCKAVAERLRSAISTAPISLAHGLELPSLTVSIGITEMTERGTIEELIGAADAALYRAKECGRDCVSE